MSHRRPAALVLLTSSAFWAFALPDKSGPIDKAWYSPPELLALLAERDGIRWALPESVAGRAQVGGPGVSTKSALDEACKQWGLAWNESNGIVVVHRPNDDQLKKWSDTLAAGGLRAAEAAWELGWLRDARAVAPLGKALAGSDPAVALAAARALDLLVREVPIGRDERVDPLPAGRVSLAAAFPLPEGLAAMLDAPHPAIRAAALRLLLAHGGKAAEAAKTKTEKDQSVLVRQVRQHAFFRPPAVKKGPPGKADVIPPLPKDPDEVKAACDKMIGELAGLEKQSAWEQMHMQPKVQPQGVSGGGMAYDPFHKVLVLQSGKKATQYGGPDDSITWTYDVRTNTWTDLQPKGGPGNPWVGAMDFDPEHNVFLVFNQKDKQVWAYRHRKVAAGK